VDDHFELAFDDGFGEETLADGSDAAAELEIFESEFSLDDANDKGQSALSANENETDEGKAEELPSAGPTKQASKSEFTGFISNVYGDNDKEEPTANESARSDDAPRTNDYPILVSIHALARRQRVDEAKVASNSRNQQNEFAVDQKQRISANSGSQK
jgi:hypothetical protein